MFDKIKQAWQILTTDPMDKVVDAYPYGYYPPHPDVRRDKNGKSTGYYQDDTDRWNIELRRQLAGFAPEFGYARCHGCQMPWWCVKNHTVMYSSHAGCFALCEMCWEQMSREQAWNYYRDLLVSSEFTPKDLETLTKNIMGDEYNKIDFPPTGGIGQAQP